MNWELFHFLRPAWLLAVLPALWLCWLQWQRGDGLARWRALVDENLLPNIVDKQSTRRAVWPFVLLAITLCCAIIALAGPTWEKRETAVYKGGDARVILLDISLSMASPDVKPSRMVRAKQKVLDLIKGSAGAQTALIAFTNVPYVISPLTDDGDTIAALLPSLDTDIAPVQGSRPALALARAGRLLTQAGVRKGSVLLVTDTQVGATVLDTARALAIQGHTVSVLGIGTRDGAPIAQPGGGYLKDAQGQLVLPRLDTAALRTLARAGDGIYTDMTSDDTDVQRLLAVKPNALLVNSLQKQRQEAALWYEQGPWLLFLVLPLAALLFRRGVL